MAKESTHGMSEKEGKAWGHGQYANMPQEVKMNMYPKAHQMGPTVENDTMTRVDAENSKAESKSHKYMSNQH